ncbi:MAG: LicD family protein [Oscillospiraceae bacterium]|nr:LicD family protein [Oscillospiraceae bacterium]
MQTETAMTLEQQKNIRELQSLVLEILLVMDKLCKEFGISYYLAEGTLLGAVRHGGFVPWDDDVDIVMPRKDHDRFIKLAEKHLPAGYCVDSVHTNPKHWTNTSFVQMTRDVPHKKTRLSGIALHNGPCVDILALDFVPCYSNQLKRREMMTRVFRRTLWVKSGLHPKSWYKTPEKRLRLYYPAKIIAAFMSFSALQNAIYRQMTMTDDSSHQFYSVFASLYRMNRETFPKKWFAEPVYLDFEGHKLPVPREYHKVLTRIYGDYTVLPPVAKRTSKHFFDSIVQNNETHEMQNDEETHEKPTDNTKGAAWRKIIIP